MRIQIAVIISLVLTGMGLGYGVANVPAADPAKANAMPAIIPPDGVQDLAITQKRISEAIDTVWPAVVQIWSQSGETVNLVSGVVVTPDGYIVTCAHHNLSVGTNILIRCANGDQASGTVLGSHRGWDIGVMKITDQGKWPHVKFGKSALMKSGDLCIALGYPGGEGLGQVSLDHVKPLVRVGRVVETFGAPAQIRTSCRLGAGDSGGGLFDLNGYLIGINLGMTAQTRAATVHAGAELLSAHWKNLIAGKQVDLLQELGLGQATTDFWKHATDHPPVVDVLSEGVRTALGTVVGEDGWILTKASQVPGTISCRLADGQMLPATVRGTSPKHDLALLKIDANNLPTVRWSDRKTLLLGTLIAAAGLKDSAGDVGTVGTTTRSIPRIPGWLHVNLRLIAKGLEVHDQGGRSLPPQPLKNGDILTHVCGKPTPDMKAYVAITQKPGVGVVGCFAGDFVPVTVRRDGKQMELKVQTHPEISTGSHQSLRRHAFPLVFSSDIVIPTTACGGPIFDAAGLAVGITIARANNVETYVLPAKVVQSALHKMFKQSKTE